MIVGDLVFESYSTTATTPATASFTFGAGSVLAGDINNPNEVDSGYGLATLGLVFNGGGLYQGDVYGASTTTVNGPGRWVLTGGTLQLGTTTVSGGVLQLGSALNDSAGLLAVGLTTSVNSGLVDPLDGLNPYAGNTAMNASFADSVLSNGDDSLGDVLRVERPQVTGDITVNQGAALWASADIFGSLTNNGTLLAGYWLTGANGPVIVPGTLTVSGGFTQGSTGVIQANFAPGWVENADGSFSAANVPAALIKVGGAATVGGTINVFETRGLYANGQTETILTSTGALTNTSATVSSLPSLFVKFETTTSGDNLDLQVERTSYASVATTANEAAVGHALELGGAGCDREPRLGQFERGQERRRHGRPARQPGLRSGGRLGRLGERGPEEPDARLLLGADGDRHRRGLPQRGQPARAAAPQRRRGRRLGPSLRLPDQRHGSGDGQPRRCRARRDVGTQQLKVGVAGGLSYANLSTSDVLSGNIQSYQFGGYANWMPGKFYVDGSLWGMFGNTSTHRNLTALDRTANGPTASPSSAATSRPATSSRSASST